MYLVFKVRYNLDKSEIKELRDRGLSEEREIIDFIESNMDFRELDTAFSHGDIWEFTQEMKNEHPAPFPVALIERIISSTNANLILDPFMGSGTTAIAARKLGRDFIGIEISPEYIELSKRRISEYLWR